VRGFGATGRSTSRNPGLSWKGQSDAAADLADAVHNLPDLHARGQIIKHNWIKRDLEKYLAKWGALREVAIFASVARTWIETHKEENRD